MATERSHSPALQEVWDEAAIDFEEEIARACDGQCLQLEDRPPDGYPKHTAEDVFGQLDRCNADSDESANFSYGVLFGIKNAAMALGLYVNELFPGPDIDRYAGQFEEDHA